MLKKIRYKNKKVFCYKSFICWMFSDALNNRIATTTLLDEADDVKPKHQQFYLETQQFVISWHVYLSLYMRRRYLGKHYAT